LNRAATGVGQKETNARKALTHGKDVCDGDGHARLTYIEDNAVVAVSEFNLSKRGRGGARLAAPVGCRRQSPKVFV
jgi:hypothetical protein